MCTENKEELYICFGMIKMRKNNTNSLYRLHGTDQHASNNLYVRFLILLKNINFRMIKISEKIIMNKKLSDKSLSKRLIV